MKPRTLAVVGFIMGVTFVSAPDIVGDAQPLSWRIGKALLFISASLPALELGVRIGARLSTKVLTRKQMHPSEHDAEIARKPITLLNVLLFALTAALFSLGLSYQLNGYAHLAQVLLSIGTSTALATLLTAALTFTRTISRALDDDDVEAS